MKSQFKSLTLAIHVGLVLLGCGPLRSAAATATDYYGTNLIANGGFEAGLAGWQVSSAQGNSSFAIDTSLKHSGTSSALTTVRGPDFAEWDQVVELLPYARYRFSGWIKTSGVQGMPGIPDAGARLRACLKSK